MQLDTENAGPEMQKLLQRLREMGSNNLDVFPGKNPKVTNEQIAQAVNNCLDALEKGDYEEILDED